MSKPGRYPGIPEPSGNPESMRETVLALKQAVEILLGQRRGMTVTSAVTWEDLIELGLIKGDQVPR